MTPRRLLTGLAAAVAFILCTLILTGLLIPEREIRGVIARGLEQEGFTLTGGTFRLALPLGISGRNVTIASPDGPVLKLDRASVAIPLLPLAIGRVSVDWRGTLGAGEFSGSYTPQGGGKGTARLAGIKLEDIPFFKSALGAEARGTLRADARFSGSRATGNGEFRIEVKQADLRGVKFGATPLPDAAFETIQGMVRLAGGRATIDSFSLQGDGIYVRLKGDFPLATPLGSAPLNLTLELMPKPEFLEKQKLVFLLLVKYLDTPGHYQIPVRGTLAKPAL